MRIVIIGNEKHNRDSLKQLLKSSFPELTIVERKDSKHSFDYTFQKICIPIISGFKLIAVDQIIRLEANSNYTTFFLTDGHRFVATRPLGEFETKLSGKGFFRCHRSFLINLNFVDEFVAGQNASIVLTDQKHLPLARNRREAFLRIFSNEM